MLFGTAISTFLNNYPFVDVVSRISGLEYKRFGTEETAYVPIIVWLIELKKACEYMYHGTVFGRKTMQL